MEIPKTVEEMLDWMVKYDPNFVGDREKAITHLLKLGGEAYYLHGLENIEPLDQEVYEALVHAGNESLKTQLLDD